MPDMRILYVEDEKYLADAVIHILKKAHIAVDWASNGDIGLELALITNYDCIVLDIMLPKISGLELLKILRKRGIATPVIMLSALSEVNDKVRALDIGADDYLTKPFKTTELIARIKALTRRPPLQPENILTFGDLSYDRNMRSLNNLALTTKEAELLEILIRHPKQVHPKSSLLSYVWGADASTSDNYVEVYISCLRKKLKWLKSSVKIKTMRNLGYKLVNE